ncbi:MAG: hypothetical protein QXP42_00320 [Candidatus Micrarchaeia archaeon]
MGIAASLQSANSATKRQNKRVVGGRLRFAEIEPRGFRRKFSVEGAIEEFMAAGEKGRRKIEEMERMEREEFELQKVGERGFGEVTEVIGVPSEPMSPPVVGGGESLLAQAYSFVNIIAVLGRLMGERKTEKAKP